MGIAWAARERRCAPVGDEASEGAAAAVIEYEGVEHRVPVRHDHFLFVAWDTLYVADPVLKCFE